MGNRRSLTKVVLSNTAVSSTTVYTSSWFPMDTFVAVGGQVVFTGTMTGTLIAQFSYDVVPALESQYVAGITPVNFNTASISVNSAVAASIAISSAATVSFEIGNGGAISANWIRLQYTNATNSGTIVSATIVGKNFG